MRIWFISDTHTFHEKFVVPPNIDMVIHCGDESTEMDSLYNNIECLDFLKWFEALPIKYKLFTPGNHSLSFQNNQIDLDLFPGITFLFHEAVTIEGIKIFGSPYSLPYNGVPWAYCEEPYKMEQLWKEIPDDLDILVTHIPPNGILDLCKNYGKFEQGGCVSLLNRVKEVRPRYHAFGHIHSETNCNNFGVFTTEDTKFINCACWCRKIDKLYKGIVMDINMGKIEHV